MSEATSLSFPRAVEAESAVKIKRLDATSAKRWDEYVQHAPSATFFHRAGWSQVLERGLRHRTYFLYAEHQGSIRGVLPLGHVQSRLFGNALMSTPFCVYGGAVADTPAVRQSLEDAAIELAKELGVKYLELRNQSQTRPDCPTKELYVTFRKEISSDVDTNLNAIPRKQRAMVRKGIQAHLVGEIDSAIDRFYLAYSTSVRNLGTPVFPRGYFAVLKEVFGDDCELLIVTKDARIVSAVMSFYFRDEILPYYGGGTDEARVLKGNDFMYWELMRRASERGVHVFDFGRSKLGTGAYDFKRNWGFEPQPLAYQYCLLRGSTVPDINPLNPKYRFFVNMWKRLPLAVANRIGPMIARNLG